MAKAKAQAPAPLKKNVGGRPRVATEVLTTAERRTRSNAMKIERGEVRINTWISPEAAASLAEMTGGDNSRGAIQAALNLALTSFFNDRRKKNA